MRRTRLDGSDLGKHLRELRLSRGLTQRELAEPAYTAAYVSTLESGRRMPSRKALQHLAAKLGVDEQELLSGRPSDLPARLALQLQAARIALSGGRLQEAERQFHQVTRAASHHDMVRLEAKGEEGLALVAERRGTAEKALEHFEKARDLLAAEPTHLRAEAVAGAARCVQMIGDLRYAIHLLESFLMVLKREELPDPTALMRVHASLVWPYSEAGLHHKAAEAATQALMLERRVSDPEQVAGMHINVARELLRQSRPDDALRSLEKAEEIYQALDFKTEVARAHLARGIVLFQEGQLEDARREFLASLETQEGSGDALNRARALNELAKVERLTGRAEEARRSLEQALSLLQTSDVAELALTHQEIAICEMDNDPLAAEKNFRMAIDLYVRAEQPMQVAITHRLLGDLLSARGDLEGAREVYREGIRALEAPS